MRAGDTGMSVVLSVVVAWLAIGILVALVFGRVIQFTTGQLSARRVRSWRDVPSSAAVDVGNK